MTQWGGKKVPVVWNGKIASERIPNREVEHHIGNISGRFEVPFGALWLPGSTERNGDVDTKHQDSKVEPQACARADCEIVKEV